MIFSGLFNKGSLTTLVFLSGFLWLPVSFAGPQSISHQNLDIKIGQAIFEKLWVFAPSSTKSSDGLGPLYNARSCHQCHELSKKNHSALPFSLVMQTSIEPTSIDTHKAYKNHIQELGFIPEPSYGKQLQTFAYPGAKAEAEISVSYEQVEFTFADGNKASLSKPNYTISTLSYGDFHPDFRWSPRVAPRMVGLSWLEAIPVDTLRLNADPDDANNDGISGKINWVWDLQSQSIQAGRFGWKAAKANLDQQNLAALSTDIGVSSWLFPKAEGDCTEQQTHCTHLAKITETHLVNTPDTSLAIEASKEMTDLLLFFTASLSPQTHHMQTENKLAKYEQGLHLFKQVGCLNCHINKYENVTNTYSKDNKTFTISPYTDLLVHDMGDGLTDNRKEFEASGNEWRTAPLWGISEYLKKSPNPRFLHDGRAKSITEAILWHGGEAERSKQAFSTLSKYKRTTLINFVESL